MPKFDLVYLIDDDPIFVFGTQRMMELAGFCQEVRVFSHGQEALDHLLPRLLQGDTALPDLILLDLNMPVLDGWQFLDELTPQASRIFNRTYIVTSSISPVDRERYQQYAGLQGYLEKPLTRQALNSIMAEPVGAHLQGSEVPSNAQGL